MNSRIVEMMELELLLVSRSCPHDILYTIIITNRLFFLQNKIRAQRELLRAKLVEEHKYLLGIVASNIGLTLEQVLEFVLEEKWVSAI